MGGCARDDHMGPEGGCEQQPFVAFFSRDCFSNYFCCLECCRGGWPALCQGAVNPSYSGWGCCCHCCREGCIVESCNGPTTHTGPACGAAVHRWWHSAMRCISRSSACGIDIETYLAK